MNHYSKKSTDELMQISVNVLTELQKRFMHGFTNVVFRQSKKALVLKGGIPADRKGWLYLPFLEKISGFFQPEEDGNGKIYHQLLPPGTNLEIVSHAGVKESFVVTSDNSECDIEIDNAFIKGPIKKI